ncbi:MAG TPA: hypothetical protein VHS09_11255 [Polyangiaceae bacterium]|nr:hypothetical protein [Polyangiaceae bacterium]
MGTALPLDRVTSLALEPGARVVVHGAMTTSVDGSVFDVTTQWDGLSPGASRPGGLFDLESGGLRLVEQRADRHEYVLAATDDDGAACAVLRVPSPCLVPRVAALAHERLRTQEELRSTLSGRVELEGVIAPPPTPLVAPAILGRLCLVAVVVALVGGSLLVLRGLRRRSRSALGRVRAAARAALRAVRGDTTLDRLRGEVRAMLARACELDASRRACVRRLARIDRGALDRKRDAYARSPSPDAAETLAWLTAEVAEAERLESDLASSLLGLQRIESALRVVTLRVRDNRGTRARIGRGDPVDAAAAELHLRDEARREVDRAVGL